MNAATVTPTPAPGSPKPPSQMPSGSPEALLEMLLGGRYTPFLGPIARAHLNEWVAGYRAAAELESRLPGEACFSQDRDGPEWRALQDPRSDDFARGALSFRHHAIAQIQARNE